jgi:hypothetical protein
MPVMSQVENTNDTYMTTTATAPLTLYMPYAPSASSAQTVTVSENTVTPPALLPPTVVLTASTLSFKPGDAPATLVWVSSNATQCTGTNFATQGQPNGSVSVTLTKTTAYTVTCTGPGGSATDAKTITYSTSASGSCIPIYYCADSSTIANTCNGNTTHCIAPTICSAGVCILPPPPNGTLKAQPSLVAKNSPTTLIWTTANVVADSCIVSGDNGDRWTNQDSSGSDGVQTSPIAQRVTYTLSCTGINGDPLDLHTTVTVAPTWSEQ